MVRNICKVYTHKEYNVFTMLLQECYGKNCADHTEPYKTKIKSCTNDTHDDKESKFNPSI